MKCENCNEQHPKQMVEYKRFNDLSYPELIREMKYAKLELIKYRVLKKDLGKIIQDEKINIEDEKHVLLKHKYEFYDVMVFNCTNYLTDLCRKITGLKEQEEHKWQFKEMKKMKP